MKRIFCACMLLACLSTSSDAALVVATCGTVTYTAGQTREITVDTTGKTCT